MKVGYIPDVGVISPGQFHLVFAVCCATCGRVDIFPHVSREWGKEGTQPRAADQGKLFAMARKWRRRAGEGPSGEDCWVWLCPDHAKVGE